MAIEQLDFSEILQSNKPNYSVKEPEDYPHVLTKIGDLKEGDRYGVKYYVRRIDSDGLHYHKDDGENGSYCSVTTNLNHIVKKQIK